MPRSGTVDDHPGRRWGPWMVAGAAALIAGLGTRRRHAPGTARWTRTVHASPAPTVPPRSTSARLTGAQVRATLDARSFDTVFQPVFGLHDGRVLAVEALTRFAPLPTAPAGAPPLAPPIWFASAWGAGLGRELELATIAAALGRSAPLTCGVPLSLNLSPATLLDPRLVRLLDAHPERPVILELTEHALIEDYATARLAVDRLRDRGCQLAVDDAGAGFASLRHVVRLAPELIKLDASLTQDIEHDTVRRALAASLVLFAHRTGSRLVAEGIERADDLSAWCQLGADGAQGYLLARPGPIRAWDEGPVLVRDAAPVRSTARPRTP